LTHTVNMAGCFIHQWLFKQKPATSNSCGLFY